MEEDLVHFLSTNSGVLAEVSTRVYWATRPQSSQLPSMTLQRISDVPVSDECGANNLTETRVQVDCWAASGLAALKAARAVEAALSGRAFTHRNTKFVGCYIDGGRDSVEAGPTSGSVIHRTRIDVQILHKEI